jgi:hypothetical protein
MLGLPVFHPELFSERMTWRLSCQRIFAAGQLYIGLRLSVYNHSNAAAHSHMLIAIAGLSGGR